MHANANIQLFTILLGDNSRHVEVLIKLIEKVKERQTSNDISQTAATTSASILNAGTEASPNISGNQNKSEK